MIGNPLKIKDIISELERGGIKIPEIQRSYVWNRSQIARLLDSIYQSYPAGSVLLWDTGNQIQMRDMATDLGRNVKPDFSPKIVLDGQQRLTSLARVFDTKSARSDRILFNMTDETFEPYSPRNAADPRWLDVTELLTGGLNELDVLDRLYDTNVLERSDRDRRNEIHGRLKKLSSIREFQFPVEIVRDDDLETVTEIFIRVNSAGTRLREAELALARLAWKLPGSIVGPFQELENECEHRGFDLDSRFFMRALVSTATRQSRFRDLKAFWEKPSAEIEASWAKTDKGVRSTLDFVEGNVGIPGSEFLPSSLALIPLVVVFSEREHLTGDEERALRRWFLVASAFSRFSAKSETVLNQDLAILGTKCDNVEGLLTQAIKDLRAEPQVTAQDLDLSGTNSPFFPLAYLAVVRRDAKDWFKGIKLRRDSFSEDQNIEYHHIFPKKHLNALKIDRYKRDEMANIAFLGQKANRKILASRPEIYLAEVADHDPERLTAQFVPMDRTLWTLDRYDDFLTARREALAAAMNDVFAG